MAKKVRFPLEMKDGVMVRTLHDLTENFDLEKALEYAGNGKLETWLRDRMCAEMADEVQKLDVSDGKAGQKLCEIIFSVGSVAFEQDDLYDILEKGRDKIYLLGEEFEIPLEQKNVTYIGLNTPVILVNSKEIVDWEEKGIWIKDCVFDQVYRGLLEEEAKNVSEARKYYEETKEQSPEEVTHSYEELEKIAEERLAGDQETGSSEKVVSGTESVNQETSYTVGGYQDNSYIHFMLSNKDIQSVEKCYDSIKEELYHLEYDIDRDVAEVRQKIMQENLPEIAEAFIEKL